MKEEEMREQEKALMLANIEKVRREDAETQKQKYERVKIMNAEVKVANKNAIDRKFAAREVEKDLDSKIAAHQKAVIAREEAAVREAIRIKEEKEREIQRLREL